MMRCLYCDKEMSPTATVTEQTLQWHKRCVKKFFDTSQFPEIDIDEDALKALATESVSKGYTVTGVQKKLSLHLTEGNRSEKPRLTLVNYPTGYILKPQTEEYIALPEAEYLTMSMAEQVGIKTVPFALLKNNNNLVYISKRIDREKDLTGEKETRQLAMEDFCQLDRRLTEDKYKGSYEQCGRIIEKYSIRPKLDMTEFYIRVIFSYLVGNSDMHLKNFSLVETREASQEYVLSPAYDMLPVNVILPSDLDQMALTVNGKKRNIRKKDFLLLAESCHIEKRVALRLIEMVLKKADTFISMCKDSYLPEEMRDSLIQLIIERSQTFLS